MDTKLVTAAKHLLVVGESDASSAACRDLLVGAGFRVTCAAPGALRQSNQAQAFAVGVLDVNENDRSWIDLLDHLRSNYPGIRTIVYAQEESFEAVQEALHHGAYAYVLKRSDPDQLAEQVERAIRATAATTTYDPSHCRELMDDVSAIVWECELPSWRFTFVSEHAELILGYPVSQWLNEPDFWVNLIHEDDRDWCVETCKNWTERGEDHEFDYRVVAADGRVVGVRDVVRVVKDASGCPSHLRGVMVDITDKKAAEESLRISEELFRQLAENVNAVMWMRSGDGKDSIYVSPKYEEIWGRSNETLQKNPDSFLGAVLDADRPRLLEAYQALNDDGPVEDYDVEYRIERPDGEIRWIRDRGFIIRDEHGNAVRQAGFSEDITESRKMLELSRIRGRVLEAASVAVVVSDTGRAERPIIDCNPAFEQLIGYDKSELVGRNCGLLWAGDEDQEGVRRLAEAVMEGRECTATLRCYRKNGQAFWDEISIFPVHDQNGKINHFVGFHQDITARTQSQMKLRESEEKFRVLAEESPAVVLIAREERIVYCNPALSKLLGYSVSELLQMDFLQFIHPDHQWIVADRHRRRLSGEKIRDQYEIIVVTKEGEHRWLDLSAQRIAFDGAPAVLVNCLDVTERKITEERLRQMESQLAHVTRLSSMGEMVAGIAHEVNQPLSAIANFALASEKTLAAVNYDFDVPVREWLHEINEQAVRCGDIIQNLRNFVQKGDDQREWTDLNRIVDESVAMVESELRHHRVVISCDLPPTAPQVHVNHVQLQQVLVNLLRNACDATSEQQSAEVDVEVWLQDGRIHLTVQDNGRGVEEAQREKLFDAFFTTKPDGMGMGLAISRSIIESHDGCLRLDSGSIAGARFHIELPDSESLTSKQIECQTDQSYL